MSEQIRAQHRLMISQVLKAVGESLPDLIGKVEREELEPSDAMLSLITRLEILRAETDKVVEEMRKAEWWT